MKKRNVTTVTWDFSTGPKNRLDTAVDMPGCTNWGQPTGEDVPIRKIVISEPLEDDRRCRRAHFEIYEGCAVVPTTASAFVCRSLYAMPELRDLAYHNSVAIFDLRKGESFVDGAIRIARTVLGALKARPKGYASTEDLLRSNFQIRQRTYFFGRCAMSGRDAWIPLESYYLRRHGLE